MRQLTFETFAAAAKAQGFDEVHFPRPSFSIASWWVHLAAALGSP